MKKKLFSIDGYSEIEVDFEKVDLIGCNDLTSLLKDISDGLVVKAKKDVSVYATPVNLGDELDTRKRYSMHGRVYAFEKEKRKITSRDIETFSMMLLYTDGETLVLKGENFESLYRIDNKSWDLYKPIDKAKKYLTLKKNICFTTIWGEEVFAPVGSKLCIENKDERDFFIVSNSFFKVAYTKLDEINFTREEEII